MIPILTKTRHNLFYINILIIVAYWVISHLSWLLFNHIGVLPMSIWPAAAIEVLAAFYFGWKIAPALFLGSVLANHLSLGGQLPYALTIGLTNVIGPLVGAYLVRQLITIEIKIKSYSILVLSLIILILLIPAFAATGGVGFQIILGISAPEHFFLNWSRWAIAHSIGIIVFALPVFIIQYIRKLF